MIQVTACERASQWQQALSLLMMCSKPTVVTWRSSVRCQLLCGWTFLKSLWYNTHHTGPAQGVDLLCLDFFTINPADCGPQWIWPCYPLSFKGCVFQTFANPFVYDVYVYHCLFARSYCMHTSNHIIYLSYFTPLHYSIPNLRSLYISIPNRFNWWTIDRLRWVHETAFTGEVTYAAVLSSLEEAAAWHWALLLVSMARDQGAKGGCVVFQ